MIPSLNHDVVIVGDVMLDRFVYGSCGRISPEAPVPVVRKTREVSMPGGAGNVARNVAALGGAARLIGLVGTDRVGVELVDAIGPAAQLVRSPDWQTIVKLRIIAQNQQIVRIDEETPRPASATETDALIARLRGQVETARVLVLSDYGKGVLTPDICSHALALARREGAISIVDPKGRDFDRYAGADFITPNASELAEATGLPTRTDAEVETACRMMLARVEIGAVIATRSEKGMMMVSRAGQVVSAPATAREVFDVSGAGDTVIATLALALAAGTPVTEAMRLANLAAGVVVAKLGTATCSHAELKAADRAALVGTGGVLMSPEIALQAVQGWQAEGLRVGFANGCFDVLHAGHVQMLRAARRHCDRLIVALNDDAGVRRLKGPSRPINPLEDRAEVIAGLDAVDAVTAFAEDTPLELILKLQPDRLFKGSDYTIDTVVGAREIESWGGQTVLLDLLPGRSTTGIVAKATAGAHGL
ncbi:D-beta-D-heptose 7-phosphate kinase/D-beta-D-heptose 1-phosphate adenosyltransferase [Rhodobacter viridis]|uniref:Bifunctional protein HldE n=1 Tax=Rhodobacter viridis TaxID=1054202 RepID=A0A318TS64_9RHOB|nr:D-glycero-beta-D-manno-heptose-7-phosphate kinase [Rhodobacter viridis]PYF07464.1 D-beta-D-heptose 7-phosphate kinase/D-beta-D-heptose 1-phosphate adenosyltransferase [Rhodobacter viridis]